MAVEIIMPRQGNTVESCVLNVWTKAEGDDVKAGETIAEIETDKATFELEAPADGILLKQFFAEGDDIPVLTVIGAIGEAGENVDGLAPKADSAAAPAPAAEEPRGSAEAAPEPAPATPAAAAPVPTEGSGEILISPRARTLAASKGVNLGAIAGTGPGGRIIERDILAALGSRAPLSPAAVEAVISEGLQAPNIGSGIGGRVLRSDLTVQPAAAAAPGAAAVPAAAAPGQVTEIPFKGIRKLIGERMLESLSQRAQLTLNASADARAMMAFRKRLKNSPEELGLNGITFNDFILYAVSRILPRFPDLNAHFLGDKILQFKDVHLGVAVDTPRGLMVPVIRNANRLSLKEISMESKRLAGACIEGGISPDELSGSTITISNLGSAGIESFTPVLNPPEVAILGVCNIQPKPVMEGGETAFVPHMGFSLTIDHQAADGAPAARFLKVFADALKEFDLIMAG